MTSDLRLIEPSRIRISKLAGGLALSISGEKSYDNVSLVRAFPLSDPDRYWGLLDEDGKDIGVIIDPSGLDPASRTAAEEELERRYFIPVIQRVIKAQDDHGSLIWEVETDRGPRTFTVRNMKDSIVELGGGRLLLVDVDGNRYEVPDMSRLDARSYDLILRSL
jgi:hypothetical protein